jgi:hypothetical protein
MKTQSMKNAIARRNRAAKKFEPYARVEKLAFSYMEYGFRVGDLKPGLQLDEVPAVLQNAIAAHEVFTYRAK